MEYVQYLHEQMAGQYLQATQLAMPSGVQMKREVEVSSEISVTVILGTTMVQQGISPLLFILVLCLCTCTIVSSAANDEIPSDWQARVQQAQMLFAPNEPDENVHQITI
jgi:hypothetical protein